MLKEQYNDSIMGALMNEFSYSSVMMVPKLVKITLNMGLGGMDSKKIDKVSRDLTMVAGQKSIITKAKKSISGFKLRVGNSIGCMVTIRSSKMFEFLERLLYLSLPRARDFKGFNRNSFDGSGNFSFGIKELSIFPEASFEESIGSSIGMDVCITTTAKNNQESMRLLELLGFPFIN